MQIAIKFGFFLLHGKFDNPFYSFYIPFTFQNPVLYLSKEHSLIKEVFLGV